MINRLLKGESHPTNTFWDKPAHFSSFQGKYNEIKHKTPFTILTGH